MRRIEIYDTTLRDGTQSHNVSPSLNDKLMIAAKLDSLGVDYIEGGYPLSNARDAAFFNEARHFKFAHAKVAAFGMTRRRGTKPTPAPPAASQPDADASQAWTSRLHWPQRRIKSQAEAYLTSLATEEAPGSAPPFALTASEITIGSDPQRATLVLSDPSVDGLHARVARNEAGAYILTDAGSTAGTWINFCLLPPDGICLEHNDLIHIGRSRFRFTLAHPAHIRKPVIRIQDQADPLPPPEDPK